MNDAPHLAVPPTPLAQFPEGGHALVQGASRGIGLGFVRTLLNNPRVGGVIATCRQPDQATALQGLATGHPKRLSIEALDVTDEDSIASAAQRIRPRTPQLSLLINAAGVLHEEAMKPEKKLEDLSLKNLQRSFQVNAAGPLLMAQHFAPLLRHRERAVFASISARVGSISDNRLGGWYAYRGAKAAQNMFTRCLALECHRRMKNLIVVALHPGTTDTDLSAPFQEGVAKGKLFTVDYSVACMLNVIDQLEHAQSGSFFAYDGVEIPW